jgi:hypothetical protein
MGEASNSDRAWMFEYDADLTTFRNTHEWCRRGVASYVQDLQNAPTTMFAWLHRHLMDRRAVMVNRVEGLPRVARSLQAEMLRQADKSILAVPLFYEDRLRAAFGFDAVRLYHRWPEAEIKALFRCGDLIALTRYGMVSHGLAQPPTFDGSAPLIYLRSPHEARGVPLSAIVCLRSARDHTVVHLSDGSQVTDLRPLGIWSGLLSPASFVQIHRTAIVNLLHVGSVSRGTAAWTVEMRYLHEALPVSRSCRLELKARLGL